MQQFKDEVRRTLNIRNMQVKDVENYYLQFTKMKKSEKIQAICELEERINQAKSYEWILAVTSRDGKIVGKIEVLELSSTTAFFTIELPSNRKLKYGIEAIDQFLKICKENGYFSEIELQAKNEIVEKYKEVHSQKDYIIKVA